MSSLTITRIANVLEAQFKGAIDMSDQAKHSADTQRACLLSRSLAALVIRSLAQVDTSVAGAAVTDTYNDGGLDAIHFDPRTDTLFLVQAKWSAVGNARLDDVAANKFLAGIRDLLAGNFDKFDTKIRAKEPEVRSVLESQRPIRLRLVSVHTGTQPSPPHVLRKFDEFVNELNGGVPVASFEEFDQAGVYGLITAETVAPKIKLQVVLNDWGLIEQPYLAYYGKVHLSNVASWWEEHRNFLFAQNLRLYRSSDVNSALESTLSKAPENFWYFNNGITVICDSVTKSLAGAPDRKLGLFNCDGVSVVNGAQTVGTVGTIVGAILGGEDPEAAFVQVRIISLEKCPPDFARQITRATNLQNAVGNREFAGMDPLQHRLATDFTLDGRRYVYKAGEPDPKGEEGCGIVEATQALASERSVALAVQVKREIGAIWADTDGPPYTEIFNDGLSTAKLWRAVLVMRAVDEELHRLKASSTPRAGLVATHMNRIVLHFVFQDPEVRRSFNGPDDAASLSAAARAATGPIFAKVATYLGEKHPNDYLAGFCKNVRKCEELARAYDAPEDPEPGSQPDLWSNVLLSL
ncbi:MAG: hypothetical protein FD125_1308 [bacterium]|nr:MAG: hypothetical protein FD125_1308 [bacterium]